MLTVYELNIYYASPDGDLSPEPIETMHLTCFDEKAAVSAARKLARQHQGPVDVARAGPSPWGDRYVGTASPAWTGARQTVFERLS